MEENKSLIVGLAIFVTLVVVFQHVLYFDELYANPDFENTMTQMATSPPAWYDIFSWGGLIVASVGYIFTCLWNVMTLNISDIPAVLRVILMTPLWVAVGILFFEIVHKVIKGFPTT